jgi:hypothetical protein
LSRSSLFVPTLTAFSSPTTSWPASIAHLEHPMAHTDTFCEWIQSSWMTALTLSITRFSSRRQSVDWTTPTMKLFTIECRTNLLVLATTFNGKALSQPAATDWPPCQASGQYYLLFAYLSDDSGGTGAVTHSLCRPPVRTT